MVRQPRSEVTRRKIINAAVELFNEVGYPSAGLGDIIERVDVTKGALYHHFDSKESLAFAVIDEAMERLGSVLERSTLSSSALESLIQARLRMCRTHVLGHLGADWRAPSVHVRRIQRDRRGLLPRLDRRDGVPGKEGPGEGDVRAELDPEAVGNVIVDALVGADVISASVSGGADLVVRVIRTWEIILPTLVPEASLPYFRQFVARVSSRHLTPAQTVD